MAITGARRSLPANFPSSSGTAYLGDHTLADAILDRLLYNTYRLALTGESMCKQRTSAAAVKTTTVTKAKN
jgi:DNA replication protein DnaC